MITSLQSQHSANITYKKSLPKNSFFSNHHNLKGGGSGRVVHAKQRISSSKFLNQINNESKQKTPVNLQNKAQKITFNTGKTVKSRSCQNSTQKIATNKIGLKTLYTGVSTQRNHNSSTIKRAKKQLDRPEYEFIGTQTRTHRQQNFFYEGYKTEKINEMRWASKQLNGNKKQTILNQRQKSSNSRQKVVLQDGKWNQNAVPYKWKQVIQKYPHYLTRYEMEEIKEYKNIYYIGHKVSRKDKEKNSSSTRTNYSPTKQTSESISFDNNENQYVYEIHDHIAYRYQILQKMGKGSYGEVIKVFDHKKKQNLALKIVRNKTKFNQQAFIQIQLLTHIKQKDIDQSSNIVKIKDFIIFRKHVCIVFELLSQNLYELIIRNNYNGLSPELIRRFAIQILTALHFLKQQNIIHCDLKPQNILLRQYNKSGIKIIDLGSSCFKNQTRYTYIQSRYYRAPQITLGIKYSHQIDIWSSGCIFTQLFCGIPLFPGQNQREQMKYFVKTLGLPPKHIATLGERYSLFFNQEGQTHDSIMTTKSIDHFQLPLKNRINDPDFCDFIQGFLKWDPKQRFTPLQALNHPWIRTGLPPDISNILPNQNIQKRANRSQSRKATKSQQKHNTNQRSVQKQQDPTHIRIKKSSKLLSQKSRELKN